MLSGDTIFTSPTGFHLRGSVLKVDCNYEIQIRISCISFFTVRLGILKRICKTVLVNSGLFSANYACACETVVEIRTPVIKFSCISHLEKKKKEKKNHKPFHTTLSLL